MIRAEDLKMTQKHNETQDNRSADEKVKESLAVRGIAGAIQAMALPTFKSLDDLLRKYNLRLQKTN